VVVSMSVTITIRRARPTTLATTVMATRSFLSMEFQNESDEGLTPIDKLLYASIPREESSPAP